MIALITKDVDAIAPQKLVSACTIEKNFFGSKLKCVHALYLIIDHKTINCKNITVSIFIMLKFNLKIISVMSSQNLCNQIYIKLLFHHKL